MKRLLCFGMVLGMLLTTAAAEEAPILVDWINAPGEYADFAFAPDAPLMEIVFPQILDSDAALIRCGGKNILIDCGSSRMAARMVDMLAQLGVEKIDLVINTHPHYDHIQGIREVAKAVEIGEFAVCFEGKITEHLPKALEVCARYGIPVTQYADGMRIEAGGMVMDAWLKMDEKRSLNDRSAVWRIQFGDRTALFTADITKGAQRQLAQMMPPELLHVDILKYPHHGKEALNEEFLVATAPLLSIITNNGGREAGRDFMMMRRLPYVCTVPGYVSLTTDGQTWLVQRLPMEKPV